MKQSASYCGLLIVILSVALLAVGCGIKPKPFKYESANEIPKGPGLLTGESGEYTLYDSNKRKADKQQAAEAGTTSTSEALTPADSEEFRRFQQWQKEKEEFEEFQEWKRSNEGREAYDEFLEWKRWQSFKRWQESQSNSK